jgi:L-lysine 2,3-aminomutase
MVMSARNLSAYVEPLLGPAFEHIQTIRIGTKSLAYWPHRFVTDRDADAVLRLFEKVVSAGKHLALMAHFSHWKELSTPAAQQAITRIRSTGAEIRTQSPVLRHINDDSEIWARMWEDQVRLGCIPYYMFVERETGAKHYFDIPLARALGIYRGSVSQVSGLARTARGPSMSAFPGKVVVEGVTHVQGEKVFVLSFLQARNPDHVKRPFFARFDPEATWLTQLKPAFNRERFFFEADGALVPRERLAQGNGAPHVMHLRRLKRSER